MALPLFGGGGAMAAPFRSGIAAGVVAAAGGRPRESGRSAGRGDRPGVSIRNAA